jgi:GNAT superfamily N-acetyltransferase
MEMHRPSLMSRGSPDSPLAEKLAATEYAIYSSPGHMHRSRFGIFVSLPDFPTRWDANQMFQVRCEKDQIDALLPELETLYKGTVAGFRKLAFHHAPTAEHLPDALLSLGWNCQRHMMMTLGTLPEAAPDPRVSVHGVAFDAAELARIYDDLDELRYRQAQDIRLGGEALIAEMDGEPVGATGWFVVDGIARFRLIHTIPGSRRRGVATALIREVVRRTRSRGIRQICIHCPEKGPIGLYRGLGFQTQGLLWYCVRQDAGAETGSRHSAL